MYDKPFISESKLRIAVLHRLLDFAVISASASAYMASFVITGSDDINSYFGLPVALNMVIALWLYPDFGVYFLFNT
jgi:hypothetical protein